MLVPKKTEDDSGGDPGFRCVRCGGSVVKPFCDGTHSKIVFIGAERRSSKRRLLPHRLEQDPLGR